jgi:hypothetical protein
VVPLVEVALDVRWEGALQGYYLVAERAGGVGHGVGAAEEVEDAQWVVRSDKFLWHCFIYFKPVRVVQVPAAAGDPLFVAIGVDFKLQGGRARCQR